MLRPQQSPKSTLRSLIIIWLSLALPLIALGQARGRGRAVANISGERAETSDFKRGGKEQYRVIESESGSATSEGATRMGTDGLTPRRTGSNIDTTGLSRGANPNSRRGGNLEASSDASPGSEPGGICDVMYKLQQGRGRVTAKQFEATELFLLEAQKIKEGKSNRSAFEIVAERLGIDHKTAQERVLRTFARLKNMPYEGPQGLKNALKKK